MSDSLVGMVSYGRGGGGAGMGWDVALDLVVGGVWKFSVFGLVFIEGAYLFILLRIRSDLSGTGFGLSRRLPLMSI